MTFQIKHRFSGDVIFECELPPEIAEQSVDLQLGFAVKEAVKAGADGGPVNHRPKGIRMSRETLPAETVVQHDEFLTLDDWRHAIHLHRAKIAQLESELKEMRFMVAALIRAAGGEIKVGMGTILTLDGNASIHLYHNYETNELVYRA